MEEVEVVDLCASQQCLRAAAPHAAFCFTCLRLPGKQYLREREVLAIVRKARLASEAANKHLGSNTNVYAIDCEGEAVKFGIAKRPRRRLHNLSSAHFRPLTLLGSVRAHKNCEKFIHDFLAPHRIRGAWFRYCEDTIRIVELIKSKNARELKALIGFNDS